MANRVWHHLLGRGLVPTVDDFGALGTPPANPALLDHLADRFRRNWSVKSLIRSIVLSSTYAMSIAGDARAAAIDPLNAIPHRANLRRLDAESIRDSMLVLADRLDETVGGPSVPVHLTDFMTGRGRPGTNGPLDGAGRRSLYLEVRRNFPDSFLQAFDLPVPTTTIGRRTRSNVPAQGLAMLNAPFVEAMAEAFGARIEADAASPDDGVRAMFLEAFGRPATEAEIRSCREFLGSSPDASNWSELAHVVFNAKEFLFRR